ncbi:hypothetical protein RJ640_009941 [Escallonia rubra]|uniref:Retrotransposon Copia-like N-terminal domain-containing protein n=1 Tax=Escallonia rubra TaxID=112253 RepID=A0AA88RUH2_9ASTE|nr:hypothetical protein RJ640_009941 [Escallonia rubra]
MAGEHDDQVGMGNVVAGYGKAIEVDSPYYLHLFDHPGLVFVTHLLTENGENYFTWRRNMMTALESKNKVGFIDNSVTKPNVNSQDFQPWVKCNAIVLSWLTNFLAKEIQSSAAYTETASELWADLHERFTQGIAPRIYELKQNIALLQQEKVPISIHYGKLKGVWGELQALNPIPIFSCGCTCRAARKMQSMGEADKVYDFLMGLDDTFTTVHSQILSESKLNVVDSFIISSLWHGRDIQWDYNPAIGTAGGIILMWNASSLTVKDIHHGKYSISVCFSNNLDNFDWVFTGVYGPNDDELRKDLWLELLEVQRRWSKPWCVGGDFNVIRFPYEKSGESDYSSAMVDFSFFVNDAGLLDLPLTGAKYTWTNNQRNPIMSRLDRFFISADWENHFKNVAQKALPRVISDHSPIILDVNSLRKARTYFKFENMWLENEGFIDLVKNCWSSCNFEGWPSFILAKKLKILKKQLREWSKVEFGNMNSRKSQIMTEIDTLNNKEEELLLSDEDSQRRLSLQLEFHQITKMEEISWRQKSRETWLKLGDENSRYFHMMASMKRRRNFISAIYVDNSRVDDLDTIKSKAVQFYQNLLTERFEHRPLLDGIRFNSLSPEKAANLESPFTEDEVWSAVKGCKADKAPGPDGFNFGFIHACWDIIKFEVLQFVNEFHGRCGVHNG